MRQSVSRTAFEGKLVPQDPNDEPASLMLDGLAVTHGRKAAATDPSAARPWRKGLSAAADWKRSSACDTLICQAQGSTVDTVPHTVTLRSQASFGGRVPPARVGLVLEALDEQLRRAVSMAFRGRSTAPGPPPAWLAGVTDVRFVGLDGKADTHLHFEAPHLGEASAVYAQGELWESRPEPEWTAFEVLADVVNTVGASDADSDRYDGPLLRSLTRRLGRVIGDGFTEMCIEDTRRSTGRGAVVDASVLNAARALGEKLPSPRVARVVGKLDMIRDSTQTFALLLDNGEEVRGTLVSGDLAEATALFKQRVVVQGRAIYRPSGRLLRIDAELLTDGRDEHGVWSRIPAAMTRAARTREYRRPQGPTTGVNAFWGRWPGDETDEELLRALDELR